MVDHEAAAPPGDESTTAHQPAAGTRESESKLVVLPDSPDARLLIELTSHANDLSEAAHSLGRALDSGEGSDIWEPLTSHAVTAYTRPFILSNVRTRLDHMPEFRGIPSEHQPTHTMIRQYRNTTVAHSQSDLVMPLPVALLDESGHVTRVWGMSVIHPMPAAIALRFADLIMAMETLVDDAMRPITDRLRTWAQDQPLPTIRRWQYPHVTHSTDDEFNGARRRTRLPRFTNYAHIEGIQANGSPAE